MDNLTEFSTQAIKIMMDDLLATGAKIAKLGKDMNIGGGIAKATMITFIEKFCKDIKSGN